MGHTFIHLMRWKVPGEIIHCRGQALQAISLSHSLYCFLAWCFSPIRFSSFYGGGEICILAEPNNLPGTLWLCGPLDKPQGVARAWCPEPPVPGTALRSRPRTLISMPGFCHCSPWVSAERF